MTNSLSIYDGEHVYLTYFVFYRYYLYLSVYCRMYRLSPALGKAFSKAMLSVEVYHLQLMTSPATSTLLAYLTYLHSSSLMVTFSYSLTHLTYMYLIMPILLSVCILQVV